MVVMGKACESKCRRTRQGRYMPLRHIKPCVIEAHDFFVMGLVCCPTSAIK
jgi:hypothetical protein